MKSRLPSKVWMVRTKSGATLRSALRLGWGVMVSTALQDAAPKILIGHERCVVRVPMSIDSVPAIASENVATLWALPWLIAAELACCRGLFDAP